MEIRDRNSTTTTALDFDAQILGAENDYSLYRQYGKRVFDIVFAVAFLLVSFPIWLIIAALIKMEDGGPVFFIQDRTGLDGSTFKMFKFRTFRENIAPVTTGEHASENKHTAIGRFLRKTSIDEFPNFLNVLTGDMSVVGARPHVPEQDAFFAQRIHNYMDRYLQKPGISGLAQINGSSGPMTGTDDCRQRVAYDLAYVRDVTLRDDLIIILKTALVFLFRQRH